MKLRMVTIMNQFRLFFTILIGLIMNGSVIAEPCPPQRNSPSLIKPSHCSEWSSIPPSKGSLRDNECLVGGILGGDFWNPCFAPDMGSSLSSILGSTSRSSKDDWSGGTGPYKAQYFTDSSLPRHTIYAPKEISSSRKLPLIVWANGACSMIGSTFSNYLTEIASHGFMIIANGGPKSSWGTSNGNPLMDSMNGEKSRAIMLTQAIDWAEKGAANGKFGIVDMQKVATAGQSCGGVEAYSAAIYDSRVKVIGIFNTGVIDPGRRWYLKEIKQQVGYFYGGQEDFSSKYIEQDFKDISPSLPAMISSLPVGHMGTFSQQHGGQFGRISVTWWKWMLQEDQTSKSLFFNKTSSLYKDEWKIDTSHWRE